MTPETNEIIVRGKKAGWSAVQVLWWLNLPCMALDHKIPYDILNDDSTFRDHDYEFKDVLKAFLSDERHRRIAAARNAKAA